MELRKEVKMSRQLLCFNRNVNVFYQKFGLSIRLLVSAFYS